MRYNQSKPVTNNDPHNCTDITLFRYSLIVEGFGLWFCRFYNSLEFTGMIYLAATIVPHISVHIPNCQKEILVNYYNMFGEVFNNDHIGSKLKGIWG